MQSVNRNVHRQDEPEANKECVISTTPAVSSSNKENVENSTGLTSAKFRHRQGMRVSPYADVESIRKKPTAVVHYRGNATSNPPNRHPSSVTRGRQCHLQLSADSRGQFQTRIQPRRPPTLLQHPSGDPNPASSEKQDTSFWLNPKFPPLRFEDLLPPIVLAVENQEPVGCFAFSPILSARDMQASRSVGPVDGSDTSSGIYSGESVSDFLEEILSSEGSGANNLELPTTNERVAGESTDIRRNVVAGNLLASTSEPMTSPTSSYLQSNVPVITPIASSSPYGDSRRNPPL